MVAISTEALTKRYGSTTALEALDLAVEPGEVYGYLGPNGAGKTTTIRLLLGLHRPTSGRAELFGIDAWRKPVSAHRRVAYVAGEPFLWPGLTGAETLAYLARLRGGIDAAYRDVLVERFRLETSKKVRALSKGNRQKVQLQAQRERAANHEAQTTRQCVTTSLGRLSQERLDLWIDGLFVAATTAPGSPDATRAGNQLMALLNQGLGRSQAAPDESGHDDETPLEQLTPAERAAYLGLYRQELREQASPTGDPTDPRGGELPTG